MTSVQLYRKIKLWFKIVIANNILTFFYAIGFRFNLGLDYMSIFILLFISLFISILSVFMIEKAESDFIKFNKN